MQSNKLQRLKLIIDVSTSGRGCGDDGRALIELVLRLNTDRLRPSCYGLRSHRDGKHAVHCYMIRAVYLRTAYRHWTSPGGNELRQPTKHGNCGPPNSPQPAQSERMRILQNTSHPCTGQLWKSRDGFACALIKSYRRVRSTAVNPTWHKPACAVLTHWMCIHTRLGVPNECSEPVCSLTAD